MLRERRELSIDWTKFQTPYRDGAFDFIYSQTVLEHISDHDSIFRELSRITAFNGTNLHTFPSRYSLIEPHIRVPLGGLIKSETYYRAWLKLRPFNPWPVKFELDDLARTNAWYARGSMFYPSIASIKRTARRYFSVVKTVPKLWDCTVRFPWLSTRFNFVASFSLSPDHQSLGSFDQETHTIARRCRCHRLT